MKTISVRNLPKNVKDVVDSVTLETSPAFWDLIEARRKEPTLSVDELERRTR